MLHVSAIYSHHHAEYRTISRRNYKTVHKNIRDEVATYIRAELYGIII
jgi:hypothetical protein